MSKDFVSVSSLVASDGVESPDIYVLETSITGRERCLTFRLLLGLLFILDKQQAVQCIEHL